MEPIQLDDCRTLGSLDLRGLKVAIIEDDGDLQLLAQDGDVAVTFDTGAGAGDAIDGLEQLVATAEQLAEILRIRAGRPRPMRDRDDVAREGSPWRTGPPMNAPGF